MTTKKHAFYGILALVSLLGLGITQSARANFTETVQQVGANVMATGIGAINLTGLTSSGPFFPGSDGFAANVGFIESGAPPSSIDGYHGFTGPTSFGTGSGTANSSSGDFVGIYGNPTTYGAPTLWVPPGYVSGNFLSDSMTFNNSTIAGLGLTPGTYVWTWGANQNFTLIIGRGGSAPDSGSTVALLGFALAGIGMLRLKLRF